MSIGKLLIDDQPLQVLPSLAESIGLNESLVLQQIHWLLSRSKKKISGKYWVFNTYEEWRDKHFRFFSLSTVRRTIKNLEDLGLITSTTEFNKMKVDKTKWYTINYEELDNLQITTNKNDSPSAQNEQSSCSKWADESVQNEQTNNQEIPQETPTKDISSSEKNFQTEQRAKKYSFSPDDMRAAEWIFELIKKLNPNVKAKNLNEWADCVRLMRERDGHTHKDICELFKWANQDPFWSLNILSPKKLREKWEQLWIKKQASEKQPHKSTFQERNSTNWGTPEKMAEVF
jgi:hypothetical protein|nr:MAG TPA: replication protein O [Caudoviricetes sp.]